MTIQNMSDGRSFTDYRSPVESAQFYRKEFKSANSLSLRHDMQTNAEKIMGTPVCNHTASQGQSVVCGGPMAQYMSVKSKITDFPQVPVKGEYSAYLN